MSDRDEATFRLFRNLADLEHLAVLMCRKHEAVPRQLDDELRHKAAFQQVTYRFATGGAPELARTLPPIQALTDWVETLEHRAAVGILNIVAEVWVEEILDSLAMYGPVEHHALFAEVARDEARHCAAAAPNIQDAAPYVRELEQHLHAIAAHPGFIYPLCHLMGTHQVTHMAKRLHAKHKQAVARLEVQVGEHYEALVACRAEAELDLGVNPVILDKWRRSAFNMDLQPMTGFREIPWKYGDAKDPASIEARFVRAVHRTLAFEPQLNRTINIAREEIYAPRESIVGVRRHGHPGIVTAYCRPCEDLETLHRYINAQARQARVAAVEIPRIDRGLMRLQPPPRSAAVVTSLQGLGGIDFGLAPLSPIEGAVWSVGVPGTIGRGTITVGVLADHRAVDGADLCNFLNQLEHHLGVPRS